MTTPDPTLDPIVARLCEALRAGKRLTTAELVEIAQVPHERIYHYIAGAKREIAAIDGKKVCNRRRFGYWIASSEGQKLNEASKEFARMLTHAATGHATMKLVDRAKVTAEDMELLGSCVARDALARAQLQQEADIRRRIALSESTRARLDAADDEAKAPPVDAIPVKRARRKRAA